MAQSVVTLAGRSYFVSATGAYLRGEQTKQGFVLHRRPARVLGITGKSYRRMRIKQNRNDRNNKRVLAEPFYTDQGWGVEYTLPIDAAKFSVVESLITLNPGKPDAWRQVMGLPDSQSRTHTAGGDWSLPKNGKEHFDVEIWAFDGLHGSLSGAKPVKIWKSKVFTVRAMRRAA